MRFTRPTVPIARALRLAPDIRQYLWAPLLVLAVGLAATGAVAWQMWRMAQAKDLERFRSHVEQTQKNLDVRIGAYEAMLRDVAALFTTEGTPDVAAFRAHLAHLDLDRNATRDGPPAPAPQYPGLIGLTWVRAGASAALGAPFTLPGDPRRSMAVAWLDPPEWRSQASVDPSILRGSESVAAMAQARDTGEVTASARIDMVQEFWARTRSGVHLFRPLYGGARVPAGVAERRRRLEGLVGVSVRTEELLSATLPEGTRREISLEVYEGSQTSASSLVYRSDVGQWLPEAESQPRLSTIAGIAVLGRNWTLVFRTRPEFDAASDRKLVPTVVLVGVLISLLLAGANLFQSRARSALNASEQRYRQLFEASPDGVFMLDSDSGQITDANPYMAELLGLTREDLIGRPLWEIGLFADLDLGRAAHAQLLERDYHRFEQLPVRSPPGREWFVDVTCNAFRTRGRRVVQCNVRNITDRKQAQDALRDSEERYRTLVEVSPQGVWVADREGVLTYVNQYWADYGGNGAGHSTGRSWLEQVHPDDRARAGEDWLRSLRSGEVFEAEVRLCRAADSQYRWHLARAIPLRDVGQEIERWLGVFVDIHERKQTEEERDRLLLREQEMRGQAEAANRAKDDFLATLSHELRTPLNSILGWTQTLQRGDVSSQALLRALAQIESSANAQARLVNDLLNVADIGAGRLRLEVQPLQLIPLILSVIESLRPAMEARDIAFSTALDPGDTIHADPARLQQIVWNLLSNAVKFTPQGGRIRVELLRRSSHVEIAVTDSGEGINAEFLPFVFDRFRQADASIKRRHGGLGLGLAIVRHLAELHGGSVSAHSDGEGHGARFAVQLPLRAPEQPALEAAPAPPATSATPARDLRDSPLRGLRVLSVDDDPGTREMLHVALERLGAQVESAADAAEALDKLRHGPPDVLVSDIGLPGEDGYDLIRRVRGLAEPQARDLPAVALTGYARAQDQQAVLAAGYQAFAAKPVDLADLVGIILELTKKG
jgi:PAS domain S-box-containing protein